jgi:lipopolysaccharide export system permease protein
MGIGVSIRRKQRFRVRASVLRRYLTRQMAAMLALCLAALLSLFLTVRLLDLIRLLLGDSLSVGEGLKLFVSALPGLLLPLLPTSVLVAVFLAFRSLAAQNEILAMKAAGLGMASWLGPVTGFGLAATLVALAVSVHVLPWAAALQGRLLARVRPTGALNLLLARGMAEPMTGIALRGQRTPGDPTAIENVVLVDRRKPGQRAVVTARRAVLVRPDARGAWSLRLTDGTLTRVAPARGEPAIARFQTLEVPLPGPMAGIQALRAECQPLPQLRRIASDPGQGAGERRAADLEFHRRLALPFACLVVALAAAPLGIRADPNSRAAGAAPALLVFLLYYTLHSVGWRLGGAGTCPPAVAMALPNAVVGAWGVCLAVAAGQDRRWPLAAWAAKASAAYRRRTAGQP